MPPRDLSSSPIRAMASSGHDQRSASASVDRGPRGAMTKKDDAKKSSATKKEPSPAPRKQKDTRGANGGLTGKQALALWELVLKGDGKTATQRSVKLDNSEVKGL